ncbi:hypothetical protein TNCV_4617551 [Trichonephila clavipes]|nr:hypothetical protein TNCV_4617551 [Trichonephila clavipes]
MLYRVFTCYFGLQDHQISPIQRVCDIIGRQLQHRPQPAVTVPVYSMEFHTKGTATAGSDVVQSGRPIFDDFFQHLWPYIGNNTANVVFQMVKRLWLIRIDQ